MKLRSPYLLLLPVALLCGAFGPVSSGQTPLQTTTPPSAPALAGKTASATAAPLTEDALRSQWQGKLIFLRGSYLGNDLQFDKDGKIKGSPQVSSFTLSGLMIRKIHLSKTKLEIQADRYGLHFFGALPYGDESKSFDKVKISKKPVHITIERERVVLPKVKKVKKSSNKKAPQNLPASQVLKTRDEVATKPPTPAATDTSDTLVTVTPAQSAMIMHAALSNVFAGQIDKRMIARLPDYWQQYFDSKSRHRLFMPADPKIQPLSEGITPPEVLNSIDPNSNTYAQTYGVAGMALLRTVVDANGVPQEIAIARPIGFGLDENAVAAIKKSRFKPAIENGKPVPVVIDLVVTFRIYSNRTKPGSVPKGSKATVLAASAGDFDTANPHPKMLQ